MVCMEILHWRRCNICLHFLKENNKYCELVKPFTGSDTEIFNIPHNTYTIPYEPIGTFSLAFARYERVRPRLCKMCHLQHAISIVDQMQTLLHTVLSSFLENQLASTSNKQQKFIDFFFNQRPEKILFVCLRFSTVGWQMHLPRPVRPSDGGGNSSQVLQPRLGGKADETIFSLNQSISKLLSRGEVEVINQNDDQREGSDNVQLGIKTN